MRIVEESYIKRTVSQLNTYAAEHGAYHDFYGNIDSFATEPLQDLSFKSDIAYFDRISFILNVITSIIAHPHISNTTEDIILRAELVNSVTPETFRETMQDYGLWTFDGVRMIPENVHYHQNIDNLRIYENVFIVMLVKLIAAELNKYTDFYASLIETFRGQPQLSLDENNVSVALFRIQSLTKKIRYIQNTRFYKEINKAPTYLRVVHPTNILLKDRLYNYCFKFYRSLVTYPDKEALMHDFALYYSMMLMRSLRRYGFEMAQDSGKLTFDSNKCLVIPTMCFENAGYRVRFEIYGDNLGILFHIENKLVPNSAAAVAEHLLLFSPQSNFADIAELAEAADSCTTVEAISLWNMAHIEKTVLPVYRNPLSEQEVVDEWLAGKLSASRASSDLYRTFCPACQKAGVSVDDDDLRTCSGCGSVFTFFRDDAGEENVWFLKLRRSGYGKT